MKLNEQQTGARARSIRSASTARLLEVAVDYVRSCSGEVIVLASSSAAADEVARRACTRALAGVHRMRLDQLAARLAEERMLATGLSRLSGLGAKALAARVIHSAAKTGSLEYLGPIAGTPGLPGALTRTLRDVEMQKVSAQELERASQIGHDLALLAGSYATERSERGLTGQAGIFRIATDVAREGSHALCGAALLLLMVEPETAVEREFLEALATRAVDVLVLELGGGEDGVASCLDSLRRYVFSGEAAPERPADGSFRVFAASTEALEAVEIARRVLMLAREGIRFDEMAVLLRDPAAYAELTEAFRRAGVPVALAAGAQRPDTAGRALLALLACAREDLSAARFAEYLSLRQTPVELPPLCERVLLDARVIHGYERWHTRLRKAAAQYEAEIEEAAADHERVRWERRLEACRALEAVALPLVDRLHALPREAAWGRWIAALAELAEAGLREPDNVLELLEELSPMADAGPADLDSVVALIGDELRLLEPAATEDRYGRVFVSPIEASAGLAFRLVFLPGLSEGVFPRPQAEDPLLLDAARAEVSAALPRSSPEREQRLLRLAAAAATECLTVSYSRTDTIAGRERVPSLYLFEALRAARGGPSDVKQLIDAAGAEVQTRIGWPAPADEGSAIDDLEFDLAVLHRAFGAGGSPEPGGGAYLLKVHPHLHTALRARGRRWRTRWFAEDGLAEPDVETVQLLERYGPRRRSYSPTALQHFAKCPYAFFLHSVVKLRPREDVTERARMDPLTRGDLFHRTQSAVLDSLLSAGLLPISEPSLGAAYLAIEAALERVSAEAEEELAPAVAELWKAEVDVLRADLRGWAAHQAHSEREWTPVAWEVPFGEAGGLEVLDGVLVHGRIDLVERHLSGDFRITDYKTGRPPDPLPQLTGKGEVLQPLLYALAAEKLYAAPVREGRLAWATLRAGYRTAAAPLNPVARQQIAEIVEAIEHSLKNGFLPPFPREDACERCEYLTLCGPYEAERTSAKESTALRMLKDVRRRA